MRRQFKTYFLLSLMLALLLLAGAQFGYVSLVQADPGLKYTTHPSGHDIGGGLTVLFPEKAYDKQMGTAALFNYGTASAPGYFQVTTFDSPSWVGTPPTITSVDFKMDYTAAANTMGETYKIEYYVGAGGPVVLQTATGDAHSKATREWLNQPEPNDGTWNWTDVANIKFRVSVDQGDPAGTMSSMFSEYEAWVVVTIAAEPLPTAKLSVYPPSITTPYKTPGQTFSVNVTATDFIDLWGYQFILSYDTYVLTAKSFSSYDPFTLSMPSEINDTLGEVKMAYNMPYGVSEGFWGTAPIAKITFSVDYLGESTLDLHDIKLSDPFGPYPTTFTVQDGYFRNVDAGSIPTASFTYDPPSPIEQQTITFDASGSTPNGGTITEYSWNFNDGTPLVNVTSATTTHSYTWRGTYTVALHVFDSESIVGSVTQDVAVLGHDIAVYTIHTDPSPFPIGQVMDINVTVINEGDFTETFSVIAKYNATTIDTQTGIMLGSGLNTTLTFEWDTTGVALGMYNISATAGPVANEYDTADNTYYDPELKRIAVSDVAVISVVTNVTEVSAGELVQINVTVKNEGDFWREELNLTVYYDDTPIDVGGKVSPTTFVFRDPPYPRDNPALWPDYTKNVTFIWNTTGVAGGKYTIKANITLGYLSIPEHENDTSDNEFSNGEVYVKILGDIDSDGDVDCNDLFVLARAYESSNGQPTYNPDADLDGDDDVDYDDLIILVEDYGIDP